MQAVGIIPARYGSTRFPGKALALLGGIPLVVRVAMGASGAGLLDRVIVATDDERIRDVVTGHGFEAVMTSRHHASGSDRVLEAAAGAGAEVVVNIQGDEATIDGATVDSCVLPLMQRDDCDVVTLCAAVRDAAELARPHVVKVAIDSRGFALYFSRAPIPYAGRGEPDPAFHFRHIGIYAYTRRALERFCAAPASPLESLERLEQLRGLDIGLRYLVLKTGYRSVDVNTPDDLKRAEAVLGLREES